MSIQQSGGSLCPSKEPRKAKSLPSTQRPVATHPKTNGIARRTIEKGGAKGIRTQSYNSFPASQNTSNGSCVQSSLLRLPSLLISEAESNQRVSLILAFSTLSPNGISFHNSQRGRRTITSPFNAMEAPPPEVHKDALQ
ncbi:hypothetical protein TRVL_07417 [Trypanosoma vivax]|nr:hypothetical protein TRVL_07417 [Trypanosoma vivax]